MLEIYIKIVYSMFSIEIEHKQSELPPYILHSMSVRKRGGAMETILLHIIYLLFLSLVVITIIAIALIIALVVILCK